MVILVCDPSLFEDKNVFWLHFSVLYHPATAAGRKQSLYGGNLLMFGLHFTSHPFHVLKPSVSMTFWAQVAAFVMSSVNRSFSQTKTKQKKKTFGIYWSISKRKKGRCFNYLPSHRSLHLPPILSLPQWFLSFNCKRCHFREKKSFKWLQRETHLK